MSDVMLQALRDAVGTTRVCTDSDTVHFLARDAMPPQRHPTGTTVLPPLCVVCPAHTQDVVAVVRLANRHRTPVIPLGGGSGLMGGAASIVPGIVLDLSELKDMHIRAADRMAEVGAGVTMRELTQAATPHGLICGHDPWTVAVATVGGAIATNSLGYLGGKYGAMGDQVVGLDVVLPTGELLHTRAVEKASTGPALQRLFVGAEGCFGIITRATLRLFPLPQERLLQGWQWADFAAGVAAINALLAVGLRPGLLELGDQNPRPGYEPPATLYLSFEGPRRVARAEAQEAAALCKQHQGVLLPRRAVQQFWEQRHDLGDAYAEARRTRQGWRRRHPPIDYLHVALPPSAVLAYRRQSLELLASHGLQAWQTGLWDHAGLFSLVYAGGELAALTEAHRALLMLAQDVGGSMEYCHGVGTRLAPLMHREHGVGLAVLRQLKQSLDPLSILNPGKLALHEASPEPAAASVAMTS
jgi:FAD/FMN-containing dehydrogenase